MPSLFYLFGLLWKNHGAMRENPFGRKEEEGGKENGGFSSYIKTKISSEILVF